MLQTDIWIRSRRAVAALSLAAGVLALLTALAPGDKAPEFALKNQDAKEVTLAQQAGHPVLIYFYPKDGTPGCTKEACALRDNFTQIQKHGAVIFGVSTQDGKSHQGFRKEQKLPFDLLVDPNGDMAKKF